MKSMVCIVPSNSQSDEVERRLRHHRKGQNLTVRFLVRDSGIQRFAEVFVSSVEQYEGGRDKPRRVLMHGLLMEGGDFGKKVIVLYTPMGYFGDGSGFVITVDPE